MSVNMRKAERLPIDRDRLLSSRHAGLRVELRGNASRYGHRIAEVPYGRTPGASLVRY